ncbi:hypothetical protein ACKFKG_22070 [Phormidesmis sp. 146-35]
MSLQNTTIMMLGTTASGKTCYMAGMHAHMSINGSNGFLITATDNKQRKALESDWIQIVEGQGEERWPVGSIETLEYQFNYSHALQTFTQFSWMDYRGGALDDDSSAADRQQLVTRIAKSDCLFLCLSAEYLVKGYNAAAALKAKVGAINQLIIELDQVKKPTRENPFPVAIVITKADLLSSSNEQSPESISKNAAKFFHPLFVADSPWLVSIIPVSLGQNIANDPDNADVDPINIHLPVTFAVLCKLYQSRHSNSSSAKGIWRRLLSNGTEQQDLGKKIRLLDQELTEADVSVMLGGQRISSILGLAENQMQATDKLR